MTVPMVWVVAASDYDSFYLVCFREKEAEAQAIASELQMEQDMLAADIEHWEQEHEEPGHLDRDAHQAWRELKHAAFNERVMALRDGTHINRWKRATRIWSFDYSVEQVFAIPKRDV